MLGKKFVLLTMVVILTVMAAPITTSAQEGEGLELTLLEQLPPEVQEYYMPDPEAFKGQTLNVVVNASFLTFETSANTIELGAQKFEELTGATVNLIPLPENEMYNQVRLEMAVDSGVYDMMHSGAGGAKDFGLDGFLVPLPMPPDADDFYEGDLHQYMVGDTLYGLPQTADTNLFYWRTDLFEEAGLDPNDPPDTYDEVREYALLLTTDKNGNHPGDPDFDPDNIEIYGLGFKGVAGLGSSWEWYNYLYAFGGDVFDDEYNVTIDSPEAVAALQWVVDNLREYHIYPPDTATYDYTEFHTLFIQGRMAMAINWPYMYDMAQNPEQSNVVGKVAIGRKPGQVTHGGNIGGWSWNVFKMSRNQELAIAFAKFMSSPDVALSFAEVHGNSSARKSINEIMVERKPDVFGAIVANLPDGRGVKWIDTGPSWLKLEEALYQAIQEALIGEKDPETALKDAKAEIEEILEEDGFYTNILPQLLGEQ